MMSFTTKSGGRLVIAGATGIQPVTGVRQRRLVLQEPQGSSPQEQIQPGTRKVQRGGTVYVSTPARQARGAASCQHASTISVAQGGSVHRGVSTPVRKHELARQHAERLPPIEYDRYAADHQRHRHGPSTSRCRSSYKSARCPLPRPSRLGGMLGNDDIQEVGLRIQLCASIFAAEGSGSRRVIDRSHQVT